MQVNTLVFYGLIEAIVLLSLIAAGLCVLALRRGRKLVLVQNKLLALLSDYKALKSNQSVRGGNPATYKQQIDEQLKLTRDHHQSLAVGQDIALDLDPKLPSLRHSLAFRHAVLVAEKEALNASSDGTPNWQFLEAKFSRLISFYMDLARRETKAGGSGGNTHEIANELTQLLAQYRQAFMTWREDSSTPGIEAAQVSAEAFWQEQLATLDQLERSAAELVQRASPAPSSRATS